MEEFQYGIPRYIRPNKVHQEILLNGEPIGFLSTYSANVFDIIHERYFIPDVDFGMENGRWIEFKEFTSYDDAFRYASENYEEVVRLYRDGDWD